VHFIFDIRKSVAAATLLCEMNGGSIEVRELLKMLYLAEKEAITTWHRCITGDEIYSMPQGMVLGRILNLARYAVRGSDMDAWSDVFTPRTGHAISFQDRAAKDLGPLSDREEAALRGAFTKIKEMIHRHGQAYIEELHKELPEWINPGGSSIVLEPVDLLRRAGEDDDSIEEISAEVAALNSVRLALKSD
jgi:hypothetical protein